MNYQQTLDYLFSQLPMYQRIGVAAYKADLNNTIAICKLLGNPENKFKSIHVAGTNGKGSTSHLLASVLQSAGLKIGLYTSPHLKDFRERIKIKARLNDKVGQGELISEKYVIDFVEKYRADFEKIQPSFFEMTVGLAFDYFANEKVDIAVIEVGLGGRLDSTNVITPEVSVITNISIDHTALLGNSVEKIAKEKAGIIKTGIPVVIGETQIDSKYVFIKTAKEKNTSIVFADEIYKAKNVQHIKKDQLFLELDIEKNGSILYENLESELLGMYQQKNISTVLCVIDKLNEKGFQLSEEIIRSGIKNTISQTGLLGRWQILSEQPLVIADTAHNEAGIKEVLNQIKHTPHQKLHFVLGMVSDKDISKILLMLPKSAKYYFCKANIPRALPAFELSLEAKKAGLKGEVYACVKDALIAAKQSATEEDMVFVGGSTFTVAEVV
ncbi:MAG TPA: folylpolyglutamate synthase/dihydrofolate synthase family protein [Bacteroidia bacterium]|nr:folylpolyglutamate synthase/dihydrofolate synthase family protein [Bacteroidia bacterium]